EGFARRSDADKVRFFNIAAGSVEESRYYLILSQDLGYGDTQTLTGSLEEASRLLSGYTRAILTPGSSLLAPISRLRDIKGRSPCLVSMYVAWLPLFFLCKQGGSPSAVAVECEHLAA